MTKSRSFSRHPAMKAVSFILFIACVTAIVLTALYAVFMYGDMFPEDHFLGRSFSESDYWRYGANESPGGVTRTYESRYARYEHLNRAFWGLAAIFALLGLGVLITLIHLLVTCGRRPYAVRPSGSDDSPLSKGVILSPFWDKPWLDVSVCAIAALWFGCANLAHKLRWNVWSNAFNRFQIYFGSVVAVMTAFTLWWLICAVKRIKGRSALRHTLIYTLLAVLFRGFKRFLWKPVRKAWHAAVRFIRSAYDGFPLTVQIGACAVAYGLAILLFAMEGYDTHGLTLVIAVLVTAGGAVFFIRKAAYLAQIVKGIRRLAEGDHQTPVEESGRGVLRDIAQSVNAASGGLKIAVEEALRSERFKAELITNVSHDLRTPLTSVITYADLLHSEGFSHEDAPKYLEVIRNKARRLQTLTEDLFEAAKASSGETKAIPAPLDLGQLTEQVLGEMGDRLRSVSLEIRVSGRCGIVNADGRLMSRVFENLLRNIEKYALPGTRVYIDQCIEGDKAVTTFRNISKDPPQGDASRLTERFSRGDESRSTEGSGLGLAIVKSFMELQGGTCSVSTDGDLFKVTLTLPACLHADF